jgi:hypothetical protein
MGCIRGFGEKVSCMEPPMRLRPDAGLTWTRAPPAAHAPEAPVEVRRAALRETQCERNRQHYSTFSAGRPRSAGVRDRMDGGPLVSAPKLALRPRPESGTRGLTVRRPLTR